MPPYKAMKYFGVVMLALVFAQNARAENATIEIQGVSASDPGKKTPSVPASLAGYKTELLNTMFGTFKDAGHQTVKAATGAAGSGTIDKYTIELAVTNIEGKSKVEVTIKVSGRPITTPVAYRLSHGRKFTIQVGAKDAPTIFIFTVKDVD